MRRVGCGYVWFCVLGVSKRIVWIAFHGSQIQSRQGSKKQEQCDWLGYFDFRVLFFRSDFRVYLEEKKCMICTSLQEIQDIGMAFFVCVWMHERCISGQGAQVTYLEDRVWISMSQHLFYLIFKSLYRCFFFFSENGECETDML